VRSHFQETPPPHTSSHFCQTPPPPPPPPRGVISYLNSPLYLFTKTGDMYYCSLMLNRAHSVILYSVYFVITLYILQNNYRLVFFLTCWNVHLIKSLTKESFHHVLTRLHHVFFILFLLTFMFLFICSLFYTLYRLRLYIYNIHIIY